MIDQAGIMMAQGKKIACERIQGVNDNMTKSHYHEYFELYYLESGKRFHMVQDEIYEMYPGQFMIFAPYIMHRSFGDQNIPFKRLVLYFGTEKILSDELRKIIKAGVGIYKPDNQEGAVVHRILGNILEEQEKPGLLSDEYVTIQLNSLLLRAARKLEKPERVEKPDRIGEVLRFIHKNFDKEISLEQLSQTFYLSPYYLCREFKKHTNTTIVQYLNVTRIMNAQRKLLETNHSITEISRETGFSNITHFNRVFKSITGVSPSQFRKQL